MKRFLILIYVLVVAGLSISARAEAELPLLVSNIQLDEESRSFQIEGNYPTPCVENPQPKLLLDKKGRLVLDVYGQTNAEVCITVVGPRFLMALELSELKLQLGRLDLDREGTYQIFDRSGQLVAEVDFSEVVYSIPQKKTKIHGLLSADESGLYISQPSGQRVQIESAINFLDELESVHVELSGHMITHTVSQQPFFEKTNPVLRFIATEVSFSAAD